MGNLNINRTAIAGVPAEKEAFDYDSIGNWKHYLRQAEGATTLDQTRWNNRDNQITALNADANGLAYDAAGNMTACRPDKDGDWTKSYTMVWDAWNRLVMVKDAATDYIVTLCSYDGLTRRIIRTITETVLHSYYNDVWKCLEERYSATSGPLCVHYWSNRVGHRDELLRRDRATTGGTLNETLWCLMDYFDPITVANSSGEVQERYSYSAFGLASVLTPDFEPRAYSNFAWNFLFHGQFRDVDTTGWDNYGYRYYLPWLGRWLNEDPLGEVGGLNLYGFVGNSPVGAVDLLGLEEITEFSQGSADLHVNQGRDKGGVKQPAYNIKPTMGTDGKPTGLQATPRGKKHPFPPDAQNQLNDKIADKNGWFKSTREAIARQYDDVKSMATKDNLRKLGQGLKKAGKAVAKCASKKIPIVGWGLAAEGAYSGYKEEGLWGGIKGALF